MNWNLLYKRLFIIGVGTGFIIADFFFLPNIFAIINMIIGGLIILAGLFLPE